jgi:hypothetical protein
MSIKEMVSPRLADWNPINVAARVAKCHMMTRQPPRHSSIAPYCPMAASKGCTPSLPRAPMTGGHIAPPGHHARNNGRTAPAPWDVVGLFGCVPNPTARALDTAGFDCSFPPLNFFLMSSCHASNARFLQDTPSIVVADSTVQDAWFFLHTERACRGLRK